MSIHRMQAEAMSALAKQESTPHHERASWAEKETWCGELAPASVKDAWGDSCEGCVCMRFSGHEGRHEASDGANGYVRWEVIVKEAEVGPLRTGLLSWFK